MASSFDSFNPEGYQNDPTKQHVQRDYDGGYIGDDTSFPGATPLAQENFFNDNNMHSSEVYGFGMPSPSPEFASTFGWISVAVHHQGLVIACEVLGRKTESGKKNPPKNLY